MDGEVDLETLACSYQPGAERGGVDCQRKKQVKMAKVAGFSERAPVETLTARFPQEVGWLVRMPEEMQPAVPDYNGSADVKGQGPPAPLQGLILVTAMSR